MEELELQEKPGILSRISGMFGRSMESEEDSVAARPGGTEMRPQYRYTVTIRRQITSFDDAMAAANGLKRGEQQILNLSGTDSVTRQKIVDFMCGVNYAQEGTWEEIGESIFLIVPPMAYVEVAPPSPRMTSTRN